MQCTSTPRPAFAAICWLAHSNSPLLNPTTLTSWYAMPSACGNVYWQQLRTNFTCALCQPRFDAVACPDRKIRSSISVASWADWNCAAKSRHAGECSGTSEDLHGVRRGPGLDREPLRPLVCDPGVTAIDVDLFRADAERRR